MRVKKAVKGKNGIGTVHMEETYAKNRRHSLETTGQAGKTISPAAESKASDSVTGSRNSHLLTDTGRSGGWQDSGDKYRLIYHQWSSRKEPG